MVHGLDCVRPLLCVARTVLPFFHGHNRGEGVCMCVLDLGHDTCMVGVGGVCI